MDNAQILDTTRKIPGHVGFFYKNLVTNEVLSYRAEDAFVAASVIKFPLLVVLEKMFLTGEIQEMDSVTIRESDKVGGCGALALFPGEFKISYRGLCNAMIALSDNTATNVLLATCTLPRIAHEFGKIGLTGTQINRMLFDEEAKDRGIENYFVLLEIAELLEKAYRGKMGGIQDSILSTLKKQQINHKIPSRLPCDVEIAHKTGEDDGITHDVGIVYAKNPFILCFSADETDVYFAEDALRNISFTLYKRNCT